MQYNGQEKEIKLGLSSKILCSEQYKLWRQAAANLDEQTSIRLGLDSRLQNLMQLVTDKKAAITAVEAAITPEQHAHAIDLSVMSGGGMFDCKKSTAEAAKMQQKVEAVMSVNQLKAKQIAQAESDIASLEYKLNVLRSGVPGVLKSGPGNSGNNVGFSGLDDTSDIREILDAKKRLLFDDYKTKFGQKGKVRNIKAIERDAMRNAAENEAAAKAGYYERKKEFAKLAEMYPPTYENRLTPVSDEGSALIPAVHEQPLDFSDDLYVCYDINIDPKGQNREEYDTKVYMRVPNGYTGSAIRKNNTGIALEDFSGIPANVFEDGEVVPPALGGAKKRAAKKPAAKKPAAKKPAAKKPAAKKPAAKKPAAKKPAAKKPAAKKPAAKKPAAKK